MATQANAQIGKGVEVYFWDTLISSPPAYAPLGKYRQLTDILGEENPEVNSTTLDDTREQFIPGMPLGKEFAVVTTLTAASVANFEAIQAALVNVDIKLVFPAPASLTRYFTATPRGAGSGTTAPSGLQELNWNFRRSGDTTAIDPHA